MKKKTITLNPALVEINEGQIAWLPKNPRQWTQSDIDQTIASLKEDPDFLEERPVLVVPMQEDEAVTPGGKYVAFCGNLRQTGILVGKTHTSVSYVAYFPESEEDRQTVIRRAIKDNGSFGSWDPDELANWPAEVQQLHDWGVPEWVTGQDTAPKPGTGDSAAGGAGESGTSGTSSGSQTHEDDFDASQGILVRCKPGDIWELGDHRLMCGDSTDLETVRALMGGGQN